jgi:Rieske 2Fe-2S family protein
VDTWEGFLFIDLSGKAPPLTDSFEAIHERASLYNLPNLKRSRQIVYDVNCNWKLLVQNYSECYHCAPVHPMLASLTPPTSGENDLIRVLYWAATLVLNEGTGSMTMSGRACGINVADLPDEEMNRVYYCSVFPTCCSACIPTM